MLVTYYIYIQSEYKRLKLLILNSFANPEFLILLNMCTQTLYIKLFICDS